MRHLSAETRAQQKIGRAAARFPLLSHAGILGQVVDIAYTAQRIRDEDVAYALRMYEARITEDRRGRRQYASYRRMLVALITEENVEEIEADYAERWRGDESMQQMSYRLDYLNRYIARITGRSPLDIHQEARND